MRLLWIIFLPAVASQLLSLAAEFRFLLSRNKDYPTNTETGVSVLKPVRGLDPNTREAFASQAAQNYSRFEILFGVRDSGDPVVGEIERLRSAFPNVPIRLVFASTDAANAKTGTLIELARAAQFPILVINDGDIKVDPNYLARVTAPLSDPRVGVVTCPYRAWAHSAATRWEALGIATDFMPGILMAYMLGIRDFAVGATIALRASDLKAIGGFEAFPDFIADDYQTGKRIAELGKATYLSPYVVETSLGEASWRGVWLHQQRWARTVRLSKPWHYLGLPLGHAGVWIALALLLHCWMPAVLLLVLRLVSALASTALLKNTSARRFFWLAPVWDLYAFAVWVACFAGNRVYWRGRTLRLSPEGRILESS